MSLPIRARYNRTERYSFKGAIRDITQFAVKAPSNTKSTCIPERRAESSHLGRRRRRPRDVAPVGVSQPPCVAGRCPLDGGVVSVEHGLGGRLAAGGRGTDAARRLPAGPARQLQATAARRRPTTRHQHAASATQPQNCEFVARYTRVTPSM